MDVRFFTDAAAFLRAAGPVLERDPLGHSIIATVAHRRAAVAEPVETASPHWYALIGDGSAAVGVAMRTHPDPPHAGFVPSLPDAAVAALASALADRGERVPAWNGDLDAARALCEAAVPGARVEVLMRTRLFELREVVWPRRPGGELRPAGPDDEDLVVRWLAAFHRDMDVQGGRTPRPDRQPDRAGVRASLAAGLVWLWEVAGEVVHLTCAQPSMFGVSRIGPVYTPDEWRGRGYAAWVVATLSQRALDAGLRPCLYTDRANPVSNRVYRRIGYQRVRDEGNVVAVGRTGASALG